MAESILWSDRYEDCSREKTDSAKRYRPTMIETTHLIILGLAIAAGGAGWLIVQRSSTPQAAQDGAPTLLADENARKQLESTRRALEQAQQELASVKQASSLAPKLEATSKVIQLEEILSRLKAARDKIDKAGIAQLDRYKNPPPPGVMRRGFDMLQGERGMAIGEIPKLMQRAFPNDQFAFDIRRLENPFYRSPAAKDIADPSVAFSYTEFEMNQQRIMNKTNDAIQRIEGQLTALRRQIAFHL